MHAYPSQSGSNRNHEDNSQDSLQPSQGMVQHLQHVKAMQDQATALSHSVQDLQNQLQSLPSSDRIQQELQPIQDDVRRTSQDLNRLVNEQRQRNADAERLEAQAFKARMEAQAAADRIQQCQNSLHAAESKLVEKKREISRKKQEAQFKAAELEFHQQQLQHVSEEQRQAEELIQNSLDSGGKPLPIPRPSSSEGHRQQQPPSHAAVADTAACGKTGDSIFDKLKGSMDKARQVEYRVVPHLSQNGNRHAEAVAGQQEAALGAGSQQTNIARQHEVALAGPHGGISKSV